MYLKDFDYDLPKELIAQVPSQKREFSRMMVLDKILKTIEDKHFFDITNFLDENDLLVLNNTKVIPARLFGKKDTGAVIEVFLVKEIEPKIWSVLIKPSKRVKPGTIIWISSDLSVEVLQKNNDGGQ